MTHADLFQKARDISSSITTPPPPDPDLTVALVEQITPVQHRLLRELIDSLEKNVLASAHVGKTYADILTFHGSEKYDDTEFSYLFLIKGPRDRDQRVDLSRHGFRPLYDSILSDIRPFSLQFVWIPGANVNKLRVNW